MTTLQYKEFKSLNEILSRLELMRKITNNLSNSNTCASMFQTSNLANSSDILFDGTSLSLDSPYKIELNTIPSKVSILPFIKVNEVVSINVNTLVVSSSGINVDVIGPNTAILKVEFDSSKLTRPIKNLEFQLGSGGGGWWPLDNTGGNGADGIIIIVW